MALWFLVLSCPQLGLSVSLQWTCPSLVSSLPTCFAFSSGNSWHSCLPGPGPFLVWSPMACGLSRCFSPPPGVLVEGAGRSSPLSHGRLGRAAAGCSSGSWSPFREGLRAKARLLNPITEAWSRVGSLALSRPSEAQGAGPPLWVQARSQGSTPMTPCFRGWGGFVPGPGAPCPQTHVCRGHPEGRNRGLGFSVGTA